MKTWIAKIRITDDGINDDGKTEYFERTFLETQLLCMPFDVSGLDVAAVISLEEEVENPKD